MTDTLRQDVRSALQSLANARGFTAAAVVMLALGIGANTAIFSVLRATSLRASPLPDPDRVAIIWTTPPSHPESNEGARISELLAWRDETRAFHDVGWMLQWSSTLGSMRDGEPAERLNGSRLSAGAFRALGVQPQLGRYFTDEDDRMDARSDVVILSDAFWHTHFGGDPKVIGRTVVLDGQTTTIVGVMPPNFGVFDTQSDFWIPSPFTRFQVASRTANRVMTAIGHLKPGVSIERAQEDIKAITTRLAETDPEPQKGRGIRVQLLDAALFGNVRPLLHVLQAAVGFVLLIACANVASLLLIRAASRQRHVAIRASLGASRFRIMRMFLVESVMLSVSGGILGLVIAWSGVRVLVAATPTWLGPIQHIAVDPGVLAFTLGMSVVTGVAFGMIPALSVSTSDLVTPLKESSRSGTGSRQHGRIQSALVVAQVTLTLVLLVGAGLLIKSFWHLQRMNLGLDPDRVLSFETRLPATTYFKQVGIQNGFPQLDVSPVPGLLFDRVRARLQEIPGVQSAGGANIPLVGGFAMQAPFQIPGRAESNVTGGAAVDPAFSATTSDLFANYSLVTPGFFGTLRVPMIRGRDFTARDTRDILPVAIINEAMARRFWPHEDPIGQHITMTIVADDQPREIIGVVGDTPVSRWERSPAPAVYVPHLQESLRSRVPYGQSRVNIMFVLRVDQPVASIVPAVRRAVAEVNASLPVSRVEMVDESLARQVEAPRDSMVLIGIFGAIALLLAVLGLYAVVAYRVVQRTHEIGIRMALGASRTAVLSFVLRQSMFLMIAGIIFGLVGAVLLTHYLEKLLFDLTPLDITTFVTVPILFLLVASIASYVPARRATRVDPQTVLRFE